jgi:hypothetical protein
MASAAPLPPLDLQHQAAAASRSASTDVLPTAISSAPCNAHCAAFRTSLQHQPPQVHWLPNQPPCCISGAHSASATQQHCSLGQSCQEEQQWHLQHQRRTLSRTEMCAAGRLNNLLAAAAAAVTARQQQWRWRRRSKRGATTSRRSRVGS